MNRMDMESEKRGNLVLGKEVPNFEAVTTSGNIKLSD
jgi:hypothetical protein